MWAKLSGVQGNEEVEVRGVSKLERPPKQTSRTKEGKEGGNQRAASEKGSELGGRGMQDVPAIKEGIFQGGVGSGGAHEWLLSVT